MWFLRHRNKALRIQSTFMVMWDQSGIGRTLQCSRVWRGRRRRGVEGRRDICSSAKRLPMSEACSPLPWLPIAAGEAQAGAAVVASGTVFLVMTRRLFCKLAACVSFLIQFRLTLERTSTQFGWNNFGRWCLRIERGCAGFCGQRPRFAALRRCFQLQGHVPVSGVAPQPVPGEGNVAAHTTGSKPGDSTVDKFESAVAKLCREMVARLAHLKIIPEIQIRRHRSERGSTLKKGPEQR